MDSDRVRFALAQLNTVKGNIAENLKLHKKFCSEAAHQGADIITFPELSLTGYEPTMIGELALEPSSDLLKELSQHSVSNSIIIVCGCPIKNNQFKPYIGSIICFPNGKVDIYAKQYLHQGESEFCVAGAENYFFNIKQNKIALAICADFTDSRHQTHAISENADFYLVSALISKRGFSEDSLLLSNIAKKINAPVLLSNFIGETGGWDAAGKCSVWDKEGNVVVQGSDSEAGITICTIGKGAILDVSFLSIS
jgi:predicted amidohydrolase